MHPDTSPPTYDLSVNQSIATREPSSRSVSHAEALDASPHPGADGGCPRCACPYLACYPCEPVRFILVPRGGHLPVPQAAPLFLHASHWRFLPSRLNVTTAGRYRVATRSRKVSARKFGTLADPPPPVSGTPWGVHPPGQQICLWYTDSDNVILQ